MILLTLIVLVFTNLPDFPSEASSIVGITDDTGRNSVGKLAKEIVEEKPRTSFFRGAEEKRRKKKKKKKQQVSCLKKPLQNKCFKNIVKKQKILETKMKKHLGRKRFDLFETQIAAKIKNVSSEMINIKNSSMNKQLCQEMKCALEKGSKFFASF